MDPYEPHELGAQYESLSSSDSVDFDIRDEEEDMGNAPDHPAVLDVNDENSSSLTLTEESPRRARVGMCTFDTGLPCQHSYLGSDLEVLRGRTLLDDGSYHTLEILNPTGVVLVPGQTLPLAVFDPRTINMLQRCIAKDRTFGVLCKWITDENLIDLNNIGTTAEIYEYQEGQAGFRIKAKARQRFKIIKVHKHYNGVTATVKILPEICLPDALEGVRFRSLNRHRTAHPLRCRKRDAMLTSWPEWVYRQYETKRLISKIKENLTFLEEDGQTSGITTGIIIPDDPTELSFWVAHNLPIREEQVMFLLKLNSPIQRLRWELSVLHKLQVLCCNRCQNEVGLHRDTFSMSVEGPQGTYVNPGGYLHETLTLYKVKFITAVGAPSTEFSWFPGYAWSIAKCLKCHRHMGWKFTATNKKLKPKEFWGLCRGSLTVQFGGVNSDDEHSVLVF